MKKFVIALIVILGLPACSTTKLKKDAAYAPTRPVEMPAAPVGNGAIYQAGYETTWFEDVRARRVGDMLTVKLVERTRAKKDAKTTISKENTNLINNPTLFGSTPEFNVPKIIPLASNKDNNLEFRLNSEHDFEGDADSEQNNELTGDITVTVIEVLPNGYLVVRGEKGIAINQGTEYIRLSGIVRPTDIDSTNTVISTRLADASISYVGEGPLAQSNAMGWLSRFFTSALFPF